MSKLPAYKDGPGVEIDGIPFESDCLSRTEPGRPSSERCPDQSTWPTLSVPYHVLLALEDRLLHEWLRRRAPRLPHR